MSKMKYWPKAFLPEHMLNWLNLKRVKTEKKSDVNVVHLYLDENTYTPDNKIDLRPNGFTKESTFHDSPHI